jgi:hypothetical protein
MAKMSPAACQHLRKVGRERDSGQADVKFHLEKEDADILEAKERREAANKAEKHAGEQQALLEAVAPILDLKWLQETGIGGHTLKAIQEQIRWHWRIGKDCHIPTGVSKMRKVAAWVVMVRAVRRNLRGTSANEGTSLYNDG